MWRQILISVAWWLCLYPAAQADNKPTQPGVIFLVGGAGGIENLHGFARWAIRQAGIPHELRSFMWTHGKGRVIRDIQDTRHLLAKSEELRREVLSYMSSNPGKPVYLMGKSTGCLLVLQAAEKLPISSVEKIILLSPAVSPLYDLTESLRSVRSEMLCFYSKLDIVVLDWGTSIVGTADRYYTSSAGLKSFQMPDVSKPEFADYQKLRQIEWSPGKVWYGHFGGHLGNGMPLFLLFEVMPRLKLESR